MRVLVFILLGFAVDLAATSCSKKANVRPDPLDVLGTVDLSIKGQPARLWIADSEEEQLQGLMHVPAERMADLPDGSKRGMLFVFDRESVHSFWMRNTIIPLDIAYLDSDGVVVATYTMIPLDDRPGRYSSRVPVRYAIEVNAGVWSDLGVVPGDQIEIPTSALKRAP